MTMTKTDRQPEQGAADATGADTAGYLTPLYDDGEGYKGRPRPTEGTGGGGDFGALIPQPYKDAWDFLTTVRLHTVFPWL